MPPSYLPPTASSTAIKLETGTTVQLQYKTSQEHSKLMKEGIDVYLWLIHVVVEQKPTQYCETIILQ